ncbi:MAG: homocysteine S-methyltransferase family protein [Deltaproteobacteria bacterium]|jgi:methionine synthase I (cobalamin-dependent)|nr:homocysteine S-methyltransferase family protein [Deltaproteobacteria bacterium]
MNQTIRDLLNDRPVILDGAWGTQMQAKGLPDGACPDEWNLSSPERVEEVAREYVEAGSQIIITNTFSSTRLCLEQNALADKVREINVAGVEISKRAAGTEARVFASMGPTGKSLFMGEVSPEQIAESYQEQADALASGGADGIVVETMMDLKEAELAVQAAKSTGLPVVACMTFGRGKNKDHTMMGVTVAEAVECFGKLGADVIGSNCGQGLEGMLKTCEVLKERTELPIWIKSNAGIPRLEGGETVYGTTAEQFVELARPVVDAGADFIGGCCGTSPAYIELLSRAYKKSRC